MITDTPNSYSGSSTVFGLEAETEYDFNLKVEYADESGGNKGVVESKTTHVITGSYDPALPPVILDQRGFGGLTTITVEYDITLPDPEANPNNEPTELTAVKLYIGDDTTPAAVSTLEDITDTNGDGKISGTLEASGLDAMTEYT